VADTDPESKTEEPTGKRVEQARSQGDVPKTMDLPQWATLSAVSGVVLQMGGWLTRNLVPASGAVGLLVIGAGVLLWERRRR